MKNLLFDDVSMYFEIMMEKTRKKANKKYKNKAVPFKGKEAQFFLLCDIWCKLDAIYSILTSSNDSEDERSDRN